LQSRVGCNDTCALTGCELLLLLLLLLLTAEVTMTVLLLLLQLRLLSPAPPAPCKPLRRTRVLGVDEHVPLLTSIRARAVDSHDNVLLLMLLTLLPVSCACRKASTVM
jgi:hypothetical protein